MAGDLTSEERREALKEVYRQARGCTLCAQLAQTRTQVVFGAGNADADVLFVGEAPGNDEDLQGIPFVGRSGQLLNTLLAEIGMQRDDVFIANVLKCRPPQNRDPHPEEIARCSPYLWRQLELIRPTVVVTLGNFATKLLRDDPTGIRTVRGRAEERVLGTRAVRLLPVYHPAAALRSTSNLDDLRADIGLLPGLVALGPPEQPRALEPEVDTPTPAAEAEAESPPPPQPGPPESQLGLF